MDPKAVKDQVLRHMSAEARAVWTEYVLLMAAVAPRARIYWAM